MSTKSISVVLGTILALTTSLTQAGSVNSFTTNFNASETLWQGTGIPAAGFDTGNIRTPGPIGVQVRAQANTGTVTAAVGGSLGATYDDVVRVGDSTNVKLNFNGSSSNVRTAFGASASLSAFIDVNGCFGLRDPFFGTCLGVDGVDTSFTMLGVGASLNPNSGPFTANLGAQGPNGSDQENVTSTGLGLDFGPFGRLGAFADLDFRETISLTPQTIDGILRGVNRRNGDVIQQSFEIGSSDMVDLSLSGLDVGLWDFSILDVDLFGLFRNTASIVLTGSLDYIIDSFTLATLNIPLITNQFNLDFNTLSRENYFSVLVTPIPAAVWLFGSALIGFIGFARRRTVA